jgi:hypothetical protein
MHRVFLAALSLAAVTPLAAQTVVTPSNLQGWSLYDGGSPGTDPATITGAQPFDGNGSLQFNVTAPGQQPAAFYGLTSFSLSDFLSSSDNFGFSFLAPPGEVATPTIRLFLTNIGNTGTVHTTGSIGWFGSQNASWQTESFAGNTGNFFFRVTGEGQINNACDNGSAAGSFDDRRQSIDNWLNQCTGIASSVNLLTAQVSAIEVDYGTFPGITASSTTYADAVNFSLANGAQTGNFNFELRSTVSTPEPATITLLATGLVGIAGFAKRKRNRAS